MNQSIQRRLQSRISKRRNAIYRIEQDVALMVTNKRAMRDAGIDRDDYGYTGVVEGINEGKHLIKYLASDQKLDKQLASIVLGLSQQRRHYGLSDY